MADLLNIGLSGLAVSKTALAVTGHNITNANTPGFTRQDSIQQTRTPQFTGGGYIGSGSSLADVRRLYNEFLTTQVRSSTALDADTQAYLSQINQLDALLASETTGVNPGLQRLFGALQTAAEDPANIPARQLVLSEAEGLARRFNNVYDRLNEQNGFINKQLSAITDQINELAGGIARYNDAIAIAAANGQQPNDLLDSRDEAVRKLATFIGVTVVPQDDNTLNLFVGSGQPLVVGGNAARLELVPGRSDPLRSEVEFVSGNSRQGITNLVTGGEMGGLLRYRQDVLDVTLNSVGRLAIAVADQVNSQLGQGLDLKGNFGEGLFRSINDPSLVGLRSIARIGNSDPAANLNVFTEDSSQLTTTDYEVEFSSATEYRVRRVSDGQYVAAFYDDDADPATPVVVAPTPYLISSTTPLQFEGFSLAVAAGTFAAGDRFRVMPTRTAASEIRADLKKAEELAFASSLKAETGPANIGTGSITQPMLETRINAEFDRSNPSVRDPLESSVRNAPPLRILFHSGSQYSVVDVAGNVLGTGLPPAPPYSGVIVPGQNNAVSITVPADPPSIPTAFTLSTTLSGRPQAGDSFSLSFNTRGVSDNRNALRLTELQSKASIAIDRSAAQTSGTSFTDAYGDLVERVGTLTSQARVNAEATSGILKQATNDRDSVSAVSLDEEAARLIQFEQYYQASAQVIQIARNLFDTLINSF